MFVDKDREVVKEKFTQYLNNTSLKKKERKFVLREFEDFVMTSMTKW